MRNFRTVICILIAISLILCSCISAFAHENYSENIEFTDTAADPADQENGDIDENVSEDDENITDPKEEKPVLNDENADVVKASFNCYYNFPIDTGHTWINFENISDKELAVGAYELAPGDSVSVGLFNFTRNDGGGVYYNIENYLINQGRAEGRVSMTDYLTEAELARASKMICTKDRLPYINNCSTFAIDVWNVCSVKPIIPIPIPLLVYFIVMIGGGFTFNAPVQTPERDNIRYHVSSSDGDYSDVVANGSLVEGI